MSELTKEMPKKLGFGCMRLPVTDGSTENINDAAFCEMIDSYIEQGFKYFDTAYPYHNGRSEEAVGRCLVQRYARDRFFLASKMPVWLVKEYADYGKYFEEQLKKCQVEYFDFYLLHAMNKDRVKEAENLGGFQFVQSMKAEGKIRHIGFNDFIFPGSLLQCLGDVKIRFTIIHLYSLLFSVTGTFQCQQAATNPPAFHQSSTTDILL